MSVDDSNLTRICTGCKQEFPATLEYFYKSKGGKYGLASRCKQCNAKRCGEYYVSHREEMIRTAREWATQNRDRYNTYQRVYNREYYRKHPDRGEGYRIKHAEYARSYRAKNPEISREISRRYHRKKPHMSPERGRRRRARILAAHGSHTQSDIDLIMKNQKGRCWWCGKEFEKGKRKVHIDHRIPITKGGSNNPENLVLACQFCNLSKNNKLPHEWSDRLL